MPMLHDTEKNKVTRKRLDKSAIVFLAAGGLLVVLAYVIRALYLLKMQGSRVASFAANYYRD
jgi:hypothetical protein